MYLLGGGTKAPPFFLWYNEVGSNFFGLCILIPRARIIIFLARVREMLYLCVVVNRSSLLEVVMAMSKEVGQKPSDLVKFAEAEVNRLAALEVQKVDALKSARSLLKSVLRAYPTDGSATAAQSAELDQATLLEVDLEREARQVKADLRRARAAAAKARQAR